MCLPFFWVQSLYTFLPIDSFSQCFHSIQSNSVTVHHLVYFGEWQAVYFRPKNLVRRRGRVAKGVEGRDVSFHWLCREASLAPAGDSAKSILEKEIKKKSNFLIGLVWTLVVGILVASQHPLKNIYSRDFPGGPVVKPARGHRFNPWSGKIPHAMGQGSPCTTKREATTMRSLCTATRM